MKKINLLLIAGLFTVTCFGQGNKDLTVSFSTGLLANPHYPNVRARSYYNVDFDYYLTSRHILSANFNAGKHNYFDHVLSNVNSFPESPTNAEAAYLTFSILYKYRFINTRKVAANIGAGAGIMTHIREYQYWESNRGDVRQSVWINLVFPVRLDLDYKLSNRFHLGVIGGLFIHPDYPVISLHAGPRLSYTLK
jgi:hypothetical protein